VPYSTGWFFFAVLTSFNNYRNTLAAAYTKGSNPIFPISLSQLYNKRIKDSRPDRSNWMTKRNGTKWIEELISQPEG
jgi:hypothetical protein